MGSRAFTEYTGADQDLRLLAEAATCRLVLGIHAGQHSSPCQGPSLGVAPGRTPLPQGPATPLSPLAPGGTSGAQGALPHTSSAQVNSHSQPHTPYTPPTRTSTAAAAVQTPSSPYVIGTQGGYPQPDSSRSGSGTRGSFSHAVPVTPGSQRGSKQQLQHQQQQVQGQRGTPQTLDNSSSSSSVCRQAQLQTQVDSVTTHTSGDVRSSGTRVQTQAGSFQRLIHGGTSNMASLQAQVELLTPNTRGSSTGSRSGAQVQTQTEPLTPPAARSSTGSSNTARAQAQAESALSPAPGSSAKKKRTYVKRAAAGATQPLVPVFTPAGQPPYVLISFDIETSGFLGQDGRIIELALTSMPLVSRRLNNHIEQAERRHEAEHPAAQSGAQDCPTQLGQPQAEQPQCSADVAQPHREQRAAGCASAGTWPAGPPSSTAGCTADALSGLLQGLALASTVRGSAQPASTRCGEGVGVQSSRCGEGVQQGSRCWSTLTHPGVRPARWSLTSGITWAMVQAPGVPPLSAALEDMVAWVEAETDNGRLTPVLVAHNGAMFDIPFLMAEAARCSVHVPEGWMWLDTLTLAKALQLKEEGSNLKQATLQERYGVTSQGPSHRALADAQVLAGILQGMVHREAGVLEEMALGLEGRSQYQAMAGYVTRKQRS